MLEDVQKMVTAAVSELFAVDVAVQVSVPDEQFGDVASNVAMQLAKQLGKNPREIAEQIAGRLGEQQACEQVSVAGPGFLNIRVSNDVLWRNFTTDVQLQDYASKNYVLEYSCPNWFKELHTGHLYQTIVGDALGRMLEQAGATVYRTTFGGDVGLHVARALWSILQDVEGYAAARASGDPQERATFITGHYVAGSAADVDGSVAAQEIRQLNKKIYQLVTDPTTHPDISEQYMTCRQWSTDYFHYFYQRIAVQDFTKYYPESMTFEPGMKAVEGGLEDGVFVESDGAVIFEKREGLHTRVFRTKEGLPTYETKDLGVVLLEKEDFDFDQRILMTGSDQKAYMQVVWAALNEIDSRFLGTMQHLVHGTVKFADGAKMSSRLGNVTRAVDVLDAVSEKIANQTQSDEKDKVVLGAVKYEFLKYHVGSDISFDVQESVSTKGNSGPYLQYAYVRAKKIMSAQTTEEKSALNAPETISLDDLERRLARKLTQYRDIFAEAVRETAPNTLCLYLYELAQTFNQFYEKNQVVGSNSYVRWQLVERYLDVLHGGLTVLGIELPESM